MLKKKKTTANGKLVPVKSVRRTRSHRMKFCVQRGLGALPSTSERRGKSQRDFLLYGPVCINTGIACHLATAPKMTQKNRGSYSGTSVSLAFLMPSAVASITTSSFSFIEFRSTSMCFLQELDLAPPSA